MPIHYSAPKKWSELVAKSKGYGNTTRAQFFNEVLGESLDESTKLVTVTDLKAASTLPWKNNPNDFSNISKKSKDYTYVALAVDWGGGGQDETSFTTLAVLGWHNGNIDVIWGKRLLTPHDHIGEAEECLRVFNAFRCNFVAHDYTGAGAFRETFIKHAGIPISKIIPISLHRTATKDIISFHKATKQHPRDFHVLDKARSLQLTCNCIKLKVIRFFEYDYVNNDEMGLLHDFLALIENKVPTAHAGDVYTIIRNPIYKDDFAQAVNIGACALWHATGKWPNLASIANIQISTKQLDAITPGRDKTWNNDEMGGFMTRP